MAHPLNTYSDAVERLLRAAEAMNDAFGGDVPHWLRSESLTLAEACRDMRRAAIPLDRYITSAASQPPVPVLVMDHDEPMFGDDLAWTHGDQRNAMHHGWHLSQFSDGQVVIVADEDGTRFTSADADADAVAHVSAVAESPHPVDTLYQKLCQRALAAEVASLALAGQPQADA